jgi:G:T-mismatch repair DNA endonuclease (very short patch repair protein)
MSDETKEKLSLVGKKRWQESSEEYKKKFIAACLRGSAKLREHQYTKPEIIVAEELDKMEMDYAHNAFLYGKFFVDFLLEDGTIIEVLGDFWHGNPHVHPNPTKTQMRQQSKDRARESYLTKCGHKVIFLWEMDLKGDPSIVGGTVMGELKGYCTHEDAMLNVTPFCRSNGR